MIISTHDLTRRSTGKKGVDYDANGYFNSRPHKEVDLLTQAIATLTDKISTHDLTRRSTLLYHHIDLIYLFQLTTSQGGRLSYNVNPPYKKIFQLTTSQGGRHAYHWIYYSCKTFQLTTSQGGRRLFSSALNSRIEISTHDLTRRSTSGYQRS